MKTGARLGVEAVLEGQFEKAGGRVRVRWRLLRTCGGAVLAGDTWDRPADDILQVQGRLAASVVRALEITLTPEERERISRTDTHSPEAFQHYLFGRHHLEARSVPRAIEAEREFREALALDPSYARAHAALSVNLTHQAWLGGRRGIDIMAPARDAALTALSLDDSVALAHTSLALIHELFDYDPARARHPWLAFMNQPEWDPLRGDARFQALRARTGFTDTVNAETAWALTGGQAKAATP